MHMTLEADYAVRIVECLAQAAEKTDARTISQLTAIPQRFCLKILRKLVAAGVVCSYKGAKGGYRLQREPEKTTLREVIEAVEGPYMLSRCQGDEYTCTHTACRFHPVYEEISRMVREKLDTCTFAVAEPPAGRT